MKRNQKSGDSLSQLDSHIWPTVLTTCICCEMRYSSPPSTTVPNPISGTLTVVRNASCIRYIPVLYLDNRRVALCLRFSGVTVYDV